MAETVYIDTGIFVTPLLKNQPEGVIQRCTEVLESVARMSVHAVTSALTWDEVTWIAGRPAKGLPFDSARARTASELFLRLTNLEICPVDRDVLAHAEALLAATRLKPRDCVHATTAKLHGADRLVSIDGDFSGLEAAIGLPVEVLAP